MSSVTAKHALALWQQAGLLDTAKVGELNDWLARHPQADGSSRLIAVFSVIGAVLAGLGLILFVSGHWDALGPVQRVALLFAGYLAIVLLAVLAQRSGYDKVAGALWLAASLAVGANIFLLGQIFNFSLTFWQGPLLWMIAVLFMGWATQSGLQAWLAIPLGLLALGWAGGGEGWFRDDQFEFLIDPTGLRPIMPVIGLSLISLGLLVRRLPSWRFAASTWMAWGVILGLVPLVLASFDPEVFEWVFEMDPVSKQWAIVAVSAGLLAAAVVLGDFRAPHTGLALVFAGLLVFLLLMVAAFDLRGVFDSLPAFALFAITVFVVIMAVVWAGAVSQEPAWVNIGIVMASIFILGQYFSWTMELLDRAAAFTIGGLLLIAIAWWGERQRRRLLQEMAQ
jgi:uncharacterized membrane protein